MNDEVWLKLAKRVNEILAKPDVDGVAITHGTDTMEETSYFLNLVVKSDKPVVLTGSMRPSTAMSADGPLNIYNAVAIAADPTARGRGVLVRGGRRHPLGARHRQDAHDRRRHDELGRGRAARRDAVRQEHLVPHAGAGPHQEERVQHRRRDGAAARGHHLRAREHVARHHHRRRSTNGAKGLVIAGVGDGNMTAPAVEAVKAAVAKGVVVVRSSRTNGGIIRRNIELNDDELGTVASMELNPAKARVLLQLALLKTKDREDDPGLLRPLLSDEPDHGSSIRKPSGLPSSKHRRHGAGACSGVAGWRSPTAGRAQPATEPAPASLDTTMDAGEADAQAPDKRRLVKWNEFDLGFTTLRLGYGFLVRLRNRTSRTTRASSRSRTSSPTVGLRDFRLLFKGKFKTERPLTWTMGIMYDGGTKDWHFRQTGLMVGVPEISSSFFIGRTKEGYSQYKVMVGYDIWTVERSPFLDAFVPILGDGIKWMLRFTAPARPREPRVLRRRTRRRRRSSRPMTISSCGDWPIYRWFPKRARWCTWP